MLKKPVRIYSDFANPRERKVIMALEKKTANLKIMGELNPDWDEERRIIAIRARRARKWMARNFLEEVKKEDKLMAAYERQLKARKTKLKKQPERLIK